MLKITRGGMATLVALGVVLAAGSAAPGASGERVDGTSEPQAFLLKLDEKPTLREFRQSRGQGLAAARSAARDQKRDVREVQSEVIADLPDGAEPLYRTHSVIAAVGVTASVGDDRELAQIPGVVSVHPIAPKKPDNSYAVPFQSAHTAWQATGFLGEGQRIAVIDSGIDYTHASFGGPGTALAFEAAQAEEDMAADPLLFPNEKVVGGVDLVGDTYNPNDPDAPGYQPDPRPDPNPLDCGGHGSHVAGSAAGYGVSADGTPYAGPWDGSTDFGALKVGPGVAPRAELIAIKVFGCSGSTTVVAEAIDHAVDPNGDGDPSDGADVINLSLGSDFGSVQDGDSIAAQAAVAMGVSVVAAAGNAGDVTDISGSPGDAPGVLSVASSVDAESRIDGAEVVIDGSPESFGVTRSALYDWKNGPDLQGPVVLAPGGNSTACAPYPENTFDGEVVLVDWHDAAPECPSITRGDNLAAAGAIGFIFGSDSEDFSAGINGSDQIPGVLMAASGADAIRDAIAASLPVTVADTEVNAVTRTVPADNDKASPFTSRGIHTTGNVKPDVAAVGSSVFSVAVGAGAEGTGSSGTSMASPMVAGLAALLRQANPGWSPLQVKAGIMNTAAHDLFVNGSGDPPGNRYGPPRVGAGRIDAELAAGNRVLAYDPDRGAVSVSFGPVAATEPTSLQREVTLENRSGGEVGYGIQYDPINQVPGASFSVTPSEVTLGGGESATLQVVLQLDPDQLTKAVDPTAGRFAASGFPRETLAEAFGRLLLEPDGAGPALRLPVYASPRPASAMTQPESVRIHRSKATAGEPTQSAAMTLTGRGVGSATGVNGVGMGDPRDDIESIGGGFGLLTESGRSPECGGDVQDACWRIPEEQSVDLRMVGYASDAALVDDPADAKAYFALATHEPWAIPADKVYFQVDFDVDADGEPDLFLYNTRLQDGDTFVSVLLDPAGNPRVRDVQPINDRLGDVDTALYDSDVMVLPVALEALAEYGIDASNPRVSFGIETYSGFSPQSIDAIGVNPEDGALVDPLSANLFDPGITVTGPEGSGPLFEDQPGKALEITRNLASFDDDEAEGLMMVHFHNRVGSKAESVDLRGAESRTRLYLAPGTLTARVDAVQAGLPAPTGEVTFSVDGESLGSAPVESGVALLPADVPRGEGLAVEAAYSGDVDFEGSSDQVGRSDPLLEARVSSRLDKNARGWYRTPVRVEFRCTPRGSPLAEDCPYPVNLNRDVRRRVITRSIVAFDGGRASVRLPAISVDRTRPVLRIRGVRKGGTYRRVRRARCVARDRTSGVAACRIGWRKRGKRIVYTARAVDRAGNRRVLRFAVRIRR